VTETWRAANPEGLLLVPLQWTKQFRNCRLDKEAFHKWSPVLRPHSWPWQCPSFHLECLTPKFWIKNFEDRRLRFLNAGVPIILQLKYRMLIGGPKGGQIFVGGVLQLRSPNRGWRWSRETSKGVACWLPDHSEAKFAKLTSSPRETTFRIKSFVLKINSKFRWSSLEIVIVEVFWQLLRKMTDSKFACCTTSKI
jgi:hypothetical protein